MAKSKGMSPGAAPVTGGAARTVARKGPQRRARAVVAPPTPHHPAPPSLSARRKDEAVLRMLSALDDDPLAGASATIDAEAPYEAGDVGSGPVADAPVAPAVAPAEPERAEAVSEDVGETEAPPPDETGPAIPTPAPSPPPVAGASAPPLRQDAAPERHPLPIGDGATAVIRPAQAAPPFPSGMEHQHWLLGLAVAEARRLDLAVERYLGEVEDYLVSAPADDAVAVGEAALELVSRVEEVDLAAEAPTEIDLLGAPRRLEWLCDRPGVHAWSGFVVTDGGGPRSVTVGWSLSGDGGEWAMRLAYATVADAATGRILADAPEAAMLPGVLPVESRCIELMLVERAARVGRELADAVPPGSGPIAPDFAGVPEAGLYLPVYMAEGSLHAHLLADGTVLVPSQVLPAEIDGRDVAFEIKGCIPPGGSVYDSFRSDPIGRYGDGLRRRIEAELRRRVEAVPETVMEALVAFAVTWAGATAVAEDAERVERVRAIGDLGRRILARVDAIREVGPGQGPGRVPGGSGA